MAQLEVMRTVSQATVTIQVRVEVWNVNQWSEHEARWDWKATLNGETILGPNNYFETEADAIADAERALGLS